MPGLIEGASSGAGLGHAFLRHVERTRVLVHIVDGAARDPEWGYDVIRDELEAHDPALLAKPILVAFNKMDLPAAREAWPAFARRAGAPGRAGRRDLRRRRRRAGELRASLAALLPDADELAEPPEPRASSSTDIESVGDAFRVEREDGVFVVRGRKIERLAGQTNFEVEESAERFQRELARLGVDDELRRQGVGPGETVRIGAIELEWEPDDWEER